MLYYCQVYSRVAQLYTYMYPFFFRFLSLICYYRMLSRALVLYSRSLLVICFIYLCVCVCVCVQLCLTLCDPMDCSPPGCSVHGIFQARILEWVAIPFSLFIVVDMLIPNSQFIYPPPFPFDNQDPFQNLTCFYFVNKFLCKDLYHLFKILHISDII